MAFTTYYIATAVLYSITFLCSVVLLLRAFSDASRRKDAARAVLPWLKVAIAFFALSCITYACRMIMLIVYYLSSDEYHLNEDAYLALNCISRTSIVFVDALIFIILVHISSGILLVQFGKEPNPDKWLKRGSYFGAGAIAILALVQMGLKIHVTYDDSLDDFMMTYWFTVSIRAVVLFASVLALARSTYVAQKCRPEPCVAQGPTLIMCGAMFWLVRTLYGLISIFTIEKVVVSTYPGSRIPTVISPNYRLYHLIVEYIFSILPVFIVLHTIYTIASRKNNGLWSILPQ